MIHCDFSLICLFSFLLSVWKKKMMHQCPVTLISQYFSGHITINSLKAEKTYLSIKWHLWIVHLQSLGIVLISSYFYSATSCVFKNKILPYDFFVFFIFELIGIFSIFFHLSPSICALNILSQSWACLFIFLMLYFIEQEFFEDAWFLFF